MQVADKTVVISAAGAGIGRACAHALAKAGVRIVVSDIDPDRAEVVAQEVVASGGTAIAVACDVGKDADVAHLAEQAMSAFGSVDILMNHAGVAAAGPIDAIPLDDWRWVFEVNILGAVRMIRTFLPGMMERGSGWIINTASNLALFPEMPFALPYITTKAGLVGMTRALGLAVQPYGIGVSVLCPDITDTAFHFTGRLHGFDPETAAAGLPLHRQRSPESAADAVIEALRNETFLATNMPNIDHHLVEAAEAGLSPAFRVYPELGALFGAPLPVPAN